MQGKVNGNTQGIKDVVIDRLAAIYDMRMGQQEFCSKELVLELSQLTGMLGREISVFIARDGRIRDVSLGDTAKVDLPEMRLVRNSDRLSGVRCIHTHPGGDGRLSGVDTGTLRSTRLDSMAAIGVSPEGTATVMYAGFIGDTDEAGDREALIYGPMRPYRLPQRLLLEEIYVSDARLKSTTYEVEEARPERAVLVGIEKDEAFDSMAELAELAKTAGANVVRRFMQKRRSIDNATYIGGGKCEELSLTAAETEADILIFDDDLSASQLRNIENITSTRVIDRTALILDIFAQRAQSREGKLQVELAQLKYNLTKLAGQGTALSRLGGGIGTRGPGEKKLEIDRRRIKRRIYELTVELDEIKKQRDIRRVRRDKNPMPLIALVGYTNAGKSTLLNALSGAGVLAENMLFATLDPVVRQITLPDGSPAMVSDTVGFINKLPHDLVDAFRSTLEEVVNADLILHVIDASSPFAAKQREVVEEVIASLGAGDTPRIDVYNKADLLENIPSPEGAMFISAACGTSIDKLMSAAAVRLSALKKRVDITIPYDKYDCMTLIREEGSIISESHEADGTHITCILDETTLHKLKKRL